MPVDHTVEPGHEHIHDLLQHLSIFSARPRWHMKGMIGIVKQFERGAPAELFANRL